MGKFSKYGGWTIKELQQILGFAHETKVSQSMDPWLDKAIKLHDADPDKLQLMIIFGSLQKREEEAIGRDIALRQERYREFASERP